MSELNEDGKFRPLRKIETCDNIDGVVVGDQVELAMQNGASECFLTRPTPDSRPAAADTADFGFDHFSCCGSVA
jgi:hypothetical protein